MKTQPQTRLHEIIEDPNDPVYIASLKWAEDHLRDLPISKNDPRYFIWERNLAQTFRYFYKQGQDSKLSKTRR